MKMKIIGLFIVLFFLGHSFAHAQTSQFSQARSAHLIVRAQAVSASTGTFRNASSLKEDVPLFQSVVFRVLETYKGKPSGDFVRTMVGFPVEYSRDPHPESHEIQKGEEFILILVLKSDAAYCKGGIDKAYENLDCYQIWNERLIKAADEEIEAFRWMFRPEKASITVFREPGEKMSD